MQSLEHFAHAPQESDGYQRNNTGPGTLSALRVPSSPIHGLHWCGS